MTSSAIDDDPASLSRGSRRRSRGFTLLPSPAPPTGLLPLVQPLISPLIIKPLVSRALISLIKARIFGAADEVHANADNDGGINYDRFLFPLALRSDILN